MSVTVDARFAGGAIFIDEGHVTDDTEDKLVVFDGPGFEFALRPHEARALADALLTVATRLEKRKPLRRRTEIDDNLRELDN